MQSNPEHSEVPDLALRLLAELATELSTVVVLEELCCILAHRLRWLIDFDRCTLAVHFEPSSSGYWLYDLSDPQRAADTQPCYVALGEGWPGRALAASKPHFLQDLHELPPAVVLPANSCGISKQARSLMLLPLRTGEYTVGCLLFSADTPDTYSASRWNLATLLSGQVAGQLGSILAHSRREQHLQELQRLNDLKDAFLSAVSHELRMPVANMRLAIQLLGTARSKEQRENYLRILKEECAREAQLVEDLLDLKWPETSFKPVELEAIPLQDWLARIVQRFHLEAQQRQQSLKLELSPGMSTIATNPTSLERVVVELLGNACKYTPCHGSIVVAASAPSSANVVLSVSNTDSQIPQAELERIFDKFYRIPNSDPWRTRGTGIGLALVKQLVEGLGGTVGVESTAQQTTFLVKLPCVL